MSSLKQLQRALAGKADKPANGFKTPEQWAEEWGLSLSQTGKLLSRGVKKKAVETRSYRIMAGGRLYPVPHYRLK